jgi:hypothetical protein
VTEELAAAVAAAATTELADLTALAALWPNPVPAVDPDLPNNEAIWSPVDLVADNALANPEINLLSSTDRNNVLSPRFPLIAF